MIDRRDVEITQERSSKIAGDGDVCGKCGGMLMAGGMCIDCDVEARPAVPLAPKSTTRRRTKRKPREKKKPTLADLAARVAGGGR